MPIFKKYATEYLSVRFCFCYRRIANGVLCLYVDFYLNSFDCGIFCGIVAHDVFYRHAFCSTITIYLQRNCATTKKITETTTGETHLKELRKMVHFDFQFTTVTFSKVHDLYSALRLQPIWITIRICACISWMHNSHRETDFFESLAEIREASLFIQKKAKKENSAIEKWTSDCALCPLNRKFMNVISIREKLESLNSPEE